MIKPPPAKPTYDYEYGVRSAPGPRPPRICCSAVGGALALGRDRDDNSIFVSSARPVPLMSTTNDHQTWISLAVPVAARLGLRDGTAGRAILDGSWWPRSRDTVVELANLIVTMSERHLPLGRIMLNPGTWETHPHRIATGDRTTRVGWFDTLGTDLLIATTDDGHRVDLLVLDPGLPPPTARTAMEMATTGADTLSADTILAQVTSPPAGDESVDSWESEGGHVAALPHVVTR